MDVDDVIASPSDRQYKSPLSFMETTVIISIFDYLKRKIVFTFILNHFILLNINS